MDFSTLIVLIVIIIGVVTSLIEFNSRRLPRNMRFKLAMTDLGMIALLLILCVAKSILVEAIAGVLLAVLIIYVVTKTHRYRKEHNSK